MALSRKGLQLINAFIKLPFKTACKPGRLQADAWPHHLQSTCYISTVNLIPTYRTDIFKGNQRIQASIFLETTKNTASTNHSENEYKCPSKSLQHFSDLVILDHATSLVTFYDCPLPSGSQDFLKAPTAKKETAVDNPGISSPAKEAKLIMRIRHKKMKKHKLKKLRKRMYFLWSRQKRARKARRMAKYYKELEEIKKEGESFDALTYVKEQITKARKGGFYLNVFQSKEG